LPSRIAARYFHIRRDIVIIAPYYARLLPLLLLCRFTLFRHVVTPVLLSPCRATLIFLSRADIFFFAAATPYARLLRVTTMLEATHDYY